MLEERISLKEGELSKLKSLLEDSSVLTEIVIMDGKRCAACFYKDGLRVFAITYPADYQLVLGVTLMEAEDKLIDAVHNTPIPPIKTSSVSRDLLTQRGNSVVYVKTGSSYIVPKLNSNRYYVAVDNNITVSDSASVNLLVDSADIKVSRPPSNCNAKRECGLLSFIKRIFGCSRFQPQETDLQRDAEVQTRMTINEESDSLVSAMQSDSLMLPRDSLVFELLYSEDMPIESMANLVTDTDIDVSISLDILQVKYGYRTEQFTVPLRQWIAFCLTEGCQPYFGVISQDSSEVVCELIMHNELFGYVHVMKLTFAPSVISQRRGVVKARLNSYVPINNLKSLYDEYK